MEPFRLTPQSVAFLSVMAGVTAVVAIAAPFGSIALGAVALLARAPAFPAGAAQGLRSISRSM